MGRAAVIAALLLASCGADRDPSDSIVAEAYGDNLYWSCLLYTSDAADERSSVDLGGRRIIKKKKSTNVAGRRVSIRTIETRYG